MCGDAVMMNAVIWERNLNGKNQSRVGHGDSCDTYWDERKNEERGNLVSVQQDLSINLRERMKQNGDES